MGFLSKCKCYSVPKAEFVYHHPPQDEELTFDYNYVRVFGAAAKKCYCGSPNCRGYIGGGDPLNAELIVQSDSEEEFPEPVMLTKDGEIEDAVPTPKYFNNVDTESAKHMLKDRDILDNPTTNRVCFQRHLCLHFSCHKCGIEKESLPHLLRDCPNSKMVWNIL